MTLDEPEEAASVRALKAYRIPVQPQLLLDLQREQSKSDPSIERIVALISRDPGIAGPVIKLANSPLFSFPGEITSVQRAVSLLGVAEVVSLAISILLRGSLAERTVENLTPFWDSSADVAAVCSLIARELCFHQPDDAYLLGLFHNAGIPLLITRFPDAMLVMHQGYANGHPVEVEDSAWQCTHSVLGYYLARSWQIPPAVCRGILLHHDVAEVLAQAEPEHMAGNTMLAILKLAEHICHVHRMVGSTNEDLEWRRIGARVLDWLQLSEGESGELAEICQHRGIQSAAH